METACMLNFWMFFNGRSVFDWAKVTATMGVSGKWIKALVGLKKSEKSQSSEKDENVCISLSSEHLIF